MKTAKYPLIALATALLTLASCKRDNPDNNPGNQPAAPVGSLVIDVKDLVAPANFNFSAEKDLTVRVAVANANPSDKFLINIYSNVPSTGELVTSGLTNAQFEYTTTMRMPAYQEYIWIEKVNTDGSSEFEKVKAAPFISSLFTGGNQPNPHVFRKSSGMDCNSGCNTTYNNHTGNITVPNNKTYCITGTYSGAVTVSGGGTLKICGNANISSLTLNGSGKVYVLETAIVSLGGTTFNGSSTFKNWSDSVTASTSIAMNGTIYNEGKIKVNGTYTVNSNSSVTNLGIINITGNFVVNKDFVNYYKITVDGDMDNNSNGDFETYCQLWVKGSLDNDGDMYIGSSSLLKVVNNYVQSSNGDTKLGSNAVLSVKSLTLSKYIEGTGTSRGKVKVTNTTTINTNAKVKGKIDYCDSNGVETNNGVIESPAALSCTGYIASSTCNSEGFGQPPIVDADSDGVADAQDAYPNDATRAFNSYYPSATTCASIAFEDLWPATGDFDYNDMTIAFNIQKVLNAQNKVVDYKVKLKVRSVGASFDNGFGFRLDEVLPSAVSTVTGQSITKTLVTLSGNKTEANQDRAVIICFDSPEPTLNRATGSMFNTIKANPTGTSDTLYVNVAFGTPVEDAKLTIDKFNPFIITNQRRGYEVHLGNFKPTSLANASLFGTDQDRSEPSNNKYYKTANNLPWAILIPEKFDYPVEKTPITSAYNYFDDWAVSGGASITNWYQDLSQYRNTSEIY